MPDDSTSSAEIAAPSCARCEDEQRGLSSSHQHTCGGQAAENDGVHWGSVHSRPTSLHGNGATALARTTLMWPDVTCRLCLSLRGSADVPCPDKACSATHEASCRYPGWLMCFHPTKPTVPPAEATGDADV